MHIVIILFEGVDELDAIGPYRVFKAAQHAGADLEVSLRTLEHVDWVTAANGLQLRPDGPLAESAPDLVVVPGGGWNARSETGAWAEAERGELPDTLAQLHAAGVSMAGVCTGGMLLARAGLTAGRPAVTHTGALADLRETDAEVVDARVVDDGDLLTAGGVTSGIDLAIHIVEREFGSSIANAVTSELEYEPQGTVLER